MWEQYKNICVCPICRTGDAVINVDKNNAYYCGCTNGKCSLHSDSEYDDGFFEVEEQLIGYVCQFIEAYRRYPDEGEIEEMYEIDRARQYSIYLDYVDTMDDACSYVKQNMPIGY